jgi:hypothetical protein
VIRLHRRRAPWRNRLVKYTVQIDGEVVGEIRQGEVVDFAVLPGEHRLRLTVNVVFTSPERRISLNEGSLAEFICGPGGPAIESVFILLRPHRYISLDGPVQWGSTASNK